MQKFIIFSYFIISPFMKFKMNVNQLFHWPRLKNFKIKNSIY